MSEIGAIRSRSGRWENGIHGAGQGFGLHTKIYKIVAKALSNYRLQAYLSMVYGKTAYNFVCCFHFDGRNFPYS